MTTPQKFTDATARWQIFSKSNTALEASRNSYTRNKNTGSAIAISSTLLNDPQITTRPLLRAMAHILLVMNISSSQTQTDASKSQHFDEAETIRTQLLELRHENGSCDVCKHVRGKIDMEDENECNLLFRLGRVIAGERVIAREREGRDGSGGGREMPVETKAFYGRMNEKGVKME